MKISSGWTTSIACQEQFDFGQLLIAEVYVDRDEALAIEPVGEFVEDDITQPIKGHVLRPIVESSIGQKVLSWGMDALHTFGVWIDELTGAPEERGLSTHELLDGPESFWHTRFTYDYNEMGVTELPRYAINTYNYAHGIYKFL